MGDNPPCKVGMEKFRSGPEKISGKNFGKVDNPLPSVGIINLEFVRYLFV